MAGETGIQKVKRKYFCSNSKCPGAFSSQKASVGIERKDWRVCMAGVAGCYASRLLRESGLL